MKRKLLFALLLVLTLASCSLFFQEEYGTVTIDLEGGNARSINSSTGLPNLSDSELEIEITGDGQGTLYKKILASEPKFFQTLFPIGARLEINIKLNGPSASWSANAKHTVKEGNNDILLLLNKNASSLANIGFSKKTESNKYEFKIAGRSIEISSAELPVFTRDSRGRLYIAYKESSGWRLNRYESDGTQNYFAASANILNKIKNAISVKLASDPITGKVYAATTTTTTNLYLIKDDGAVTPTGGTAIPVGPIAVYNNNLFALDSPATSTDLKMFTITEGGSGLALTEVGTVSVSKEQITVSGTQIQVDFKDILVKNDKIYILFAKNSLPSGTPLAHYYSLGGMLEYTYNSSGITDNPQKYGFNNEVTAEDGIVTAGEADFYGPACFIGYDEQSISIADDGCTFKKVVGSVRIDKNVNRIFSFNTSTKSLYSYATENKWFNEYPPGTGKVLLWEKNTDSGAEGFKFYLVDEDNISASLPSTAFLQDNGPDYPTDVFCYDQEGNLYVVWFDYPSYFVRRYEKSKGYSTADTKENQQKMVNNSGSTSLSASEKPTAIAVDVSDNEKGYLYYSYNHNMKEVYIICNSWLNNSFKDGIFLKQIKSAQTIAGNVKTSIITSISADSKNIYVAQKTEYNTKRYAINVFKYKGIINSSEGYWPYANNQEHKDGNNYVDQEINDLRIQDDVLYLLITKHKGEMKNLTTDEVQSKGIFYKTTKTLTTPINNQTFTEITPSLSTDGYAPYRFIGMIPNKLIIASDGYYGKKANNESKNKNKVLSFDITSSTSWTVTPEDTSAEFSRQLMYANGTGFDWK